MIGLLMLFYSSRAYTNKKSLAILTNGKAQLTLYVNNYHEG